MIPFKPITWHTENSTGAITGRVGRTPVAIIEFSNFSHKYTLKLSTVQGLTLVPIGNIDSVEEIKKIATRKFRRYIFGFFMASSETDTKVMELA